MRARQWVKNVLVLAAPVAANVLGQPRVLAAVAVAFLCFSLAASGIYLINDLRDIRADREHPVKRFRPIAAGFVPVPLAYGAAVLLLVAAVGLALLATWQLLLVAIVYEAVQLAYCFGLKHQPVLDICIVAAGFLLRAIAGARQPIFHCRNGFCSWRLLDHCSWCRASDMQNCSSRRGLGRKSASP